MRTWMWIALLAAALVLTGCSNTTTKVKGALGFDTKVRLVFDVSSDINPDQMGRPSPLMLRVYELKTATLFERADFIDLFERDKEVLGADFIAKHEMRRITPGDERIEDLVLSNDARYVAVFAEFTQYQDAEFGLLIPVNPHGSVKQRVRIESNQLASID